MTTLGRLIIRETLSFLPNRINQSLDVQCSPYNRQPLNETISKSTSRGQEYVVSARTGTGLPGRAFNIEQEVDSFVIVWSESIILP